MTVSSYSLLEKSVKCGRDVSLAWTVVRVKAVVRQAAERCIAQDREFLSVARSAAVRAALMAAGSH